MIGLTAVGVDLESPCGFSTLCKSVTVKDEAVKRFSCFEANSPLLFRRERPLKAGLTDGWVLGVVLDEAEVRREAGWEALPLVSREEESLVPLVTADP